MNIFVGNLLFEATEAEVEKLFAGFGNVASVAIVMSKDKKAPRSRGFGFVQMSDEQQALAAIAALNGKEFLGRVLHVESARPKPKVEAQPVFNKPGTYKGGRRTHSYIKRQGLAGIEAEVKPRRRIQDNPMRWRKKGDQPKPWQKSQGEHKPREKVEGAALPWKKTEGEPKPWRTSEGGFKPRRKVSGEPNPWKKAEGESKPWKKPAGDANPWSKSSERPQKSGFKGSRKPGGYKKRR